MTVKQLIKTLQQYNPNAEVRVLYDRKTGDTAPASVIRNINEAPTYIGFTGAMIQAQMNETKEKKKGKKVIIA